MDIKVLQYIMGHAHIDVTMDVYNHLGDRSRIEKEVSRLDDSELPKKLTLNKLALIGKVEKSP